MRATLIAVLALASSACGGVTYLPDGGRARQVCVKTSDVTVPVRVLNAAGQAIEGVDVTATHTGTGTVTSGKTDANGLSTIVKEELGAGTIHVVAQLGSKTAVADVTMTCGECTCTAFPTTLTLTPQ